MSLYGTYVYLVLKLRNHFNVLINITINKKININILAGNSFSKDTLKSVVKIKFTLKNTFNLSKSHDISSLFKNNNNQNNSHLNCRVEIKLTTSNDL